MPRNSAGQYESPVPPFNPGSTILSLAMNQKFADIVAALSASLDRYGNGGMMAPLTVGDGSTAQPTYTFTSEPGLGFYRGGNSILRAAASGSVVQEWSLTYTNINRPLVITTPVANAHGVTTTGNGTGHGISATGGVALNAVSGSGISAVGGATQGSGTAGAGVVAIAGVVNPGGIGAPGVLGTGSGSAAGVAGLGGSAGGVGVSGSGAATGFGGLFTSTGGIGVYTTAASTFAGVEAVGGNTNGGGPGIRAFGGTGAAYGGVFFAGTNSTATTPQVALELGNGHLRFADAAVTPNSNVALRNTLAPSLIPKAWGMVSISGATPAIQGGANIQGAAKVTANNVDFVRITLASPLLNVNYVVKPELYGVFTTGSTPFEIRATNLTTSSFDVYLYQYFVDGSTLRATFVNIPQAGLSFGFSLFGVQ